MEGKVTIEKIRQLTQQEKMENIIREGRMNEVDGACDENGPGVSNTSSGEMDTTEWIKKSRQADLEGADHRVYHWHWRI